MKPEVIGPVEAVFDRGSFEAISEADRRPYVEHIFKFLAPNFRYILTGYEYEDPVFKGPPRCVKRELVFDIFNRKKLDGISPGSKVEIAEELDYSDYAKQRFNVQSAFKKIIYFIQEDK